MKKFLISILFLALAISGYSQDGLKGTWVQKASMMGMSATDTLSFSDSKAGKVKENMVMTINMNMFGINITGEAKGNLEGSFIYEGDKITITWDPENCSFNTTKPVEVSLKKEKSGNLSPEDQEKLDKAKKDMAAEFEELLKSTEDEMKKSVAKGDIYTNVKLTAKTLSYKSQDENGKTGTEKYSRAK